MKHLLSLFLTVALVGSVCGQTTVILPSAPVAPTPAPNPTTPTVIANQLYVIEASAPIVVLASPEGVVQITPQKGPMTIRDVFVGGSGKKEVKTFKGPNLYLVEAKGDGTCELLVVPSMDPAQVIRRTLVTQTPEPKPPEPKPPEPKPPEPVNPIPSEKLRVLCIWESAKTLPAAQTGVLNSTIWKADVAALGGDERVFDKDTDLAGPGIAPFWNQAIKRARTGLPWVVMSSPKGFYEGPLPATVAEMQALIKKVGG